MIDFKNKIVLVLGGGISGKGAMVALQQAGARPVLFDDREGIPLPNMSIFDMLVTSPGVTHKHPLCKEAKKLGKKIMGEMELAYRLLGKKPLIAITGTNGKTTTTQMIGQILQNDGKQPMVAGNIGISASRAAVEQTDTRCAVWEVSSFQLRQAKRFIPQIAIITNIAPDHLDVHRTFENYTKAKLSITKQQRKQDFLILGVDELDKDTIQSLQTNA
ncbi:MAG: Mur ligase family protein, partial [Firmicutes bacterium]|nr:Mur ligase family protein [Bacillota bacterium]